MSVRAELDKARILPRRDLERALANSGVKPRGPAGEFYVRLLRHKLGDLDGRGDPVQYPAPPAELTPFEVNFIDRATTRANEELEPTINQAAKRAKRGQHR